MHMDYCMEHPEELTKVAAVQKKVWLSTDLTLQNSLDTFFVPASLACYGSNRQSHSSACLPAGSLM